MIESIEKPQESIRKNRNPHRVIPAKAGIQKRNATGIYRKKQKPPPRHSRAGGNPETQRGRTLSEKTETLTTVIPAQMICCPSTQNKKQSCNILIYIVIFIYVYLRYANARLHKYIRVTV
ncbi:TPA: hypothetical protein ACJL1L_001898 [Neisseria meningitidis]|uniref:hypothetical protein n=1 Tax=Neisseria meningitidis TaxID=487 RepID=UPI0002DDCF8C|nr:hypothetical protein [Neisseria meningitidis]